MFLGQKTYALSSVPLNMLNSVQSQCPIPNCESTGHSNTLRQYIELESTQQWLSDTAHPCLDESNHVLKSFE